MEYVEIKGWVMVEVIVRIDATGHETAEDVEDVGKTVLREFREQLFENIIVNEPNPVGDAYPATLGFNKKIDFVIPDDQKMVLERALAELKPDTNDDNDERFDAYRPRYSLS